MITNSETTTVSELEKQIFEREEIKVVIRAKSSTEVKPYNYERKASNNASVTDFIETRIKPIVGPDIEVEIVNGQSQKPHGRTKMETLRKSYEN